jgi:5-oxoprolinase (ATP-hydrolysing)
VTWGGGGLGDPLTRPQEQVAKEVHRRLATIEGAKADYGVVVNPKTYAVDEAATARLREIQRNERAKTGYTTHNTIDRGGTISEVMARCEAETGIKPPVPQWKKKVYGPHSGLTYVKKWYETMQAEGMKRWDAL